MYLLGTIESLELVSSSTSALHVDVSFINHTSSGGTLQSANLVISSSTTTTLIGAPAASTAAQLKEVTITNVGAVSNTVRLQKNKSATLYQFGEDHILLAGETLRYSEQSGFQRYDASGILYTKSENAILNGYSRSFFKVGTAKEAVGVPYSFSKDTGFPGAFVVGTPGLSGRAIDGLSEACINYPDAVGGSTYLNGFTCSTSTAETVFLGDWVWINSGLVVTTTTAQTITSVTFPARDNNETTNGEGYQAALLVTTATTNGANIATITLSYTNSAGVAGRTATISSFPATAVIGTFVPFQLQAGDNGIRSIESITLGTSLVAGAVSIVVYNQILSLPLPLLLGSLPISKRKLPNRGCLNLRSMVGTGAAASTIHGEVYFEVS